MVRPEGTVIFCYVGSTDEFRNLKQNISSTTPKRYRISKLGEFGGSMDYIGAYWCGRYRPKQMGQRTEQ
jgi:hypothetical protein